MRTLLAINFNHDGSAVILRDGRMVAFVNTERFSRKRRHPGIREQELQALLQQAGLDLRDLDYVLLCNLGDMDSPEIAARFGTDLKETWFAFSLNDERTSVQIGGQTLPCQVNPDHHSLHAACAFFSSGFDEAMVFTSDPTGYGVFMGKAGRLERLQLELPPFRAPNLYTDVALELFGSALAGAGKVMGLAPFGGRAADNPSEAELAGLGSYQRLLGLTDGEPCFVEFGAKRWNARLAWLVQETLNVQLSRVLRCLREECARRGLEPNLCLGGGTALNSVANQLAFERSGFDALHLHPACGDDGTALGAALWYWHAQLGMPRLCWRDQQLMYSCARYDEQVARSVERAGNRIRVEAVRSAPRAAAELLAAGRVIGWFCGASEIGPRALGHRSILADPRRAEMKVRLNEQVKRREAFRPFAPAVLEEQAEAWFGVRNSPFMLRVAPVLQRGVPAVTHVDGTARVQTVARDESPEFYELIDHFYALTQVPMVLNTSFNADGEPIVETPDDAIACFLDTGLDALVFPQVVVLRGGCWI